MAGISRKYYIGGAGGFLGLDGLNGIDFEIDVWESDIRSLVVRYFDDRYEPISKDLISFVPKGPDDPDQNRKAIVLFASNLFKDCKSYEIVKKEFEGVKYVNFCNEESVPAHFYDFLEESRSIDVSEKINIYFADIRGTMI